MFVLVTDAAAGGACTNGAAHLGVLAALWAALPVLKSVSAPPG